jgi:hypothetical protein
MNILSVRAASALLEKRVNVYGPTPEAELLRYLERLEVDRERAERALSLALVRRRLVRRTEDGEAFIRRPLDWRNAA